jgi:hypothetical protein
MHIPQDLKNSPLPAGGEEEREGLGGHARTLRRGRMRQARARFFPNVIGRPREETPLCFLQRAAEFLAPRCPRRAGETEQFIRQKIADV